MNSQEIDFRFELYRKAIHLFMLVVPVCYAYTDERTVLVIILPLTLIIVPLDFFKSRTRELGEVIKKIFGPMLRAKEFSVLSGASYTLLAFCVVILLFPKTIAITAMAVEAVSDTMAGLVGRKFGRMKFFSKTVEGTLAFILSGTFVVYVIMSVFQLDLLFFVTGFVAVCIAAVVEAAAKFLHINDNLSVPLVVGLYMGVLL